MKLGAAFLAALLALSCASPAPRSQGGPARRYTNRTVGVELAFPEEWTIFTGPQGAPPMWEPLLPPDKGPNDSPLFLGLRSNAQAFVRCLAERTDMEIEDYFALLYSETREEVEILKARYSAEQETVRWRYRSKTDATKTVFFETVSISRGYAIRLAFWTVEPLLARYQEEFLRISEAMRWLEDGGWVARWEGLEDTLAPQGLEYVELVAAAPESTTDDLVCPRGERNLLWRVRGDASSVYLFGSIHLGKPEFYPLPDAVEQAFSSSRHLVVEVDIRSEVAQREIAQAMDAGHLERGETIRDVLAPEVYQQLVESLGAMGLPIDPFLSLRPWALALVLPALKIQSMGYLPAFGVDSYFLDRADELEVVELENVADQMRLLESFDTEHVLAYTLFSLDLMEVNADRMIDAWRCGDEQAMEELLLESYESELVDAEEMLERFFYERNRKMADRVEQFLRGGGSYFLVVGAGHLVGEEGLVSLLRQRGWQLQRL